MAQTNPPVRKRNTSEASYARLTAIAARQGLTLLTQRWYTLQYDYLFRCARNHEFTRLGTVAMRGTVTCLECVQEDMKLRFLEILGERGIVCREGSYLGQTARQHFRCHCGHEWSTEARKILDGHGCVVCATARRAEQLTHSDGLERLQRAAAARGGRLLADTYVGMAESYSWECAHGHRWRAGGHKVVDGSWCRLCAVSRHSEAVSKPERLSDLHAIARGHGGVCLDETYQGSNAQYRFRCAKGHEWSAWGNLVLRGTWCRHCANQAKRLTIEQMDDIARERGGRCLSEEYLGNNVKLTWQCERGHVWETTPNTVRNRGAWCPLCFRLRITKQPHLRRRYDHEG
jgi:hypothetical protein